MKKLILFLFLAAILFLQINCSKKPDLKGFLNSLPETITVPLDDKDSTRQTYKIYIRQRIDHFGTDTATFPQKIYLSHTDFSKPVVVVTSGYLAEEEKLYEPAQLLNANQIIIEHRYFGESTPSKKAWKYLNIKQAAEDDHVIVQLFKQIYKGKWLSTGISKGGQATLFYRYFYPNDVDASIAYVAPICFNRDDPRIYEFLKHVATEACRQKVFKFQKLLLENKTKLLPKFEEFSKNNGLFYKMGYEEAYEYCVLEFSFSFWQWGDLECDSIPDNSKDLNKVFSAFKRVGFSFFSEEEIESIRPFYIQALTEIGFYSYDTKPFGKLIKKIKNPGFYFALPDGVDTTYHYKSMMDVNEYLQTNGNNIIYIYGEYDPWSAAAFEQIPGKTNALKIVKKGGDHETRIKDLDPNDKKKVYFKLNEWLNCQLK